ncbi:acetate uptake transporter [Vibrio mediterranei]|uniref:acetate uptake transporter n=1 Tax=Vibrio mediterranei TaxID=689 RepID=UPI001EFCFF73|nr:acetate uptake transporter [Vibrio mediterranei]MCG9627475.1 acetate uptake transporter [Vibrio mediterranei]
MTKQHNDPSSMGLFGLALVTLIASSNKFGMTHGVSGIIPWAIFLGAGMQLYAAKLDADKANNFGMTAFGAFGCFWLGVSMHWLISLGILGSTALSSLDSHQLGFALIGYTVFSLYMTIASLTVSKTMTLLFVFIDLLLINMSLSNFDIAKDVTHNLAAISEVLISLTAFYMSASLMLNERFKRNVLPLGSAFVEV